MASLFVPPPKPKSAKIPPPRPEYDKAGAAAMIDTQRRGRGGSYRDTLVGSGIKTSFGQ